MVRLRRVGPELGRRRGQLDDDRVHVIAVAAHPRL
jgi:hypothetical protein